MDGGFGKRVKVYKIRYYRGPMLYATFLTALGMSGYFISGSYANVGANGERYCPVQDVKILSNLWYTGIMLMFYASLNLCSSGLIPSLCAKLHFKNEIQKELSAKMSEIEENYVSKQNLSEILLGLSDAIYKN